MTLVYFDTKAQQTDTTIQNSSIQVVVKTDTVFIKEKKNKKKAVIAFKTWYENQKEEGLSTNTTKTCSPSIKLINTHTN